MLSSKGSAYKSHLWRDTCTELGIYTAIGKLAPITWLNITLSDRAERPDRDVVAEDGEPGVRIRRLILRRHGRRVEAGVTGSWGTWPLRAMARPLSNAPSTIMLPATRIVLGHLGRLTASQVSAAAKVAVSLTCRTPPTEHCAPAAS